MKFINSYLYLKKVRLIIYFIFILLNWAGASTEPPVETSNPLSALGEQCTEVMKEISMPPPREQGKFGYCYAFSATQLLQHHLCKKKGGCKFSKDVPTLGRDLDEASICEDSHKMKRCIIPKDVLDDRISVLDVMARSGKAFEEGGHSHKILQKMQRSNTVAKESCAPFLPFLNSGVNPLKEVEFLFKAPSQVRCQQAEFQKHFINLQISSNQLLDALTDSNLQSANRKVFIPPECNDNLIGIPEYKVGAKADSNPKKINDKLKALIKNETPVSVSVCTTLSLLKQLSGRCEAHAMNVVGVKEVCCNNQCTTSFKIQNSNKKFEVDGRILGDDYEFWIGSVTLTSLMKPISLVSLNTGGVNMSWIEDP